MWREGGREVARTKARGRDVRMGENRVGENLMLVEEKETRKKETHRAAPHPPRGNLGRKGGYPGGKWGTRGSHR